MPVTVTVNDMRDDHARYHWNRIYSTKPGEAASWYQPHAVVSLRMIHEAGIGGDDAIIDVGGGDSMLVDDLLREGYADLTVLDLSSVALAAARERLGEQALRVKWIEADITEVELPVDAYDLWHDRAVFHFLTSPEQRAAYVATMMRSVKTGGSVIVATFAESGPGQCSGLAVVRYSPDSLHKELGDALTLLGCCLEDHRTPTGVIQPFLYCRFQKRAD